MFLRKTDNDVADRDLQRGERRRQIGCKNIAARDQTFIRRSKLRLVEIRDGIVDRARIVNQLNLYSTIAIPVALSVAANPTDRLSHRRRAPCSSPSGTARKRTSEGH